MVGALTFSILAQGSRKIPHSQSCLMCNGSVLSLLNNTASGSSVNRFACRVISLSCAFSDDVLAQVVEVAAKNGGVAGLDDS